MEFVFIWVMCGVGAAIVASNKGRSVFGWFLLGFLLGPIGFILSLVVANKKAVAEASPIHSKEEQSIHSAAEERKCPFCAETIKAEAIICRFCNRDLPPIEPKQDSAPIAETPSPGIVEHLEPPAEPLSALVTSPDPLPDQQSKHESDNSHTRIIAVALGATLLLVMGGIAYTMTMGTSQKQHDPVSATQQANKTKWWEDGPVFDIDHEGKCIKFELMPVSLWGNRLRVSSIKELESADENSVMLAAKYEDGSISEIIFYKSLISCNEALIKAKELAVVAKQPSLPKTVGAPAINVGDRYTYETESTDFNGKTTTATSTREVTSIDGDRVTVTVTSGKTGKARTLIYDRSWNLLETGDTSTAGLIYKPAIQYFDFPLTIGKKWTALAEDTDKKTGKSRQYILNAEVLGWDEIVVGAGKFDALKIIISSEVMDGDKRSTGTDVSWYAPSIGRTVKSELSGEDTEGRQDRKTVALMSHSARGGNDTTDTPENKTNNRYPSVGQADERIQKEASKMGLRVPASREQFLQAYSRQGGVCDQAQQSLGAMNASTVVASECALPAPCEPNADGIACRLIRIGFDDAGRTVYYQITMDVQKDKNYLDRFDNIYGTDRRKIKGNGVDSILLENIALRDGVRISYASLHLPKQYPEKWTLIIHYVLPK